MVLKIMNQSRDAQKIHAKMHAWILEMELQN